MIKISTGNKRIFYYVSNLVTGTIIIIDGSSNSIVKSIFVGKRPFKIAMMNNYKLYIACDRSRSIAILDCISEDIRTIRISNNGIIEVDELNQRMFSSDTSEIRVYEISTGKLIRKIKGFLAVSGLKLNKDMSKLYVLDRLLSEFRIYRTDDFSLIYRSNNLGINPGCILISSDDNTVYVAIEGDDFNLHSCYILKIDIECKKVTKLSLPNESLVEEMLIEGDTLYVANKTMNRVEVIDIESFRLYDFILTSLPQPTGLCIADDNTKLLVTNRNCGGIGGIDIIDITSNCVISSIKMDSYNSQPYDVVAVSLDLSDMDDISSTAMDLSIVGYIKEPIVIITKKIALYYDKEIKFPSIIVRLSPNMNLKYFLKEIRFERGFIVNGSETRTLILGSPGFFRVQFKVRITYIIYYVDVVGKKYSHKGFLEEVEEVILSIPNQVQNKEYEFILDTFSELLNMPNVLDNVIRFGVKTYLNIKVVEEDKNTIPALESSSEQLNGQKYLDPVEDEYKPLCGYNGVIFPEGATFPWEKDELAEN